MVGYLRTLTECKLTPRPGKVKIKEIAMKTTREGDVKLAAQTIVQKHMPVIEEHPEKAAQEAGASSEVPPK